MLAVCFLSEVFTPVSILHYCEGKKWMPRAALYILWNTPLLCSFSCLDFQINMLANEGLICKIFLWHWHYGQELLTLWTWPFVTVCGTGRNKGVKCQEQALNAVAQIRWKSHLSEQVLTLTYWKGGGYCELHFISDNSQYGTSGNKSTKRKWT